MTDEEAAAIILADSVHIPYRLRKTNEHPYSTMADTQMHESKNMPLKLIRTKGKMKSQRISLNKSFSKFVNEPTNPLVIEDIEQEERQQVDFAKTMKKIIDNKKNMNNQGEFEGEKKISKDVKKDAKKKRKYIIKDDIKDAKKKRKEQSIQGDLLKDTKNEKKRASLKEDKEGDNDEELEGSSSSTNSDFAIPCPKKPKKDTKDKAIVSAHTDETVEDVATPLSMKYNVIRSRTSPKTLYETISSLTNSQMEVVRQMGFGSLLQLKMDGIPWKLGYYIVDNLDTKKMEITMKSRSLKITKDAIHDVLGLPNEGTDLFDLDSHEDNLGEWKNQFGKVRIHLKDVMRDINTSRDAGWRFKMNFITLFSNTMATTFSNGTCNPIVLSHINRDTDFNQIDWSKYIWDSLKTSKVGWNRDSDNIFYTGPITFLTLFYVDSTKCNIIVSRQRPVLANWTTQQLKQREEAEIRAGGFGNLELQDPVQEVEVQELQAIEGAHAVETKGNREERFCTTSLSNNVEAFLKEINTRITQFLTEKVMIETALQEALLQHPGVVEIEECKSKFHALFQTTVFQEEFVADATNEMECMDKDEDHLIPSTNEHELVMQDIIAEEAEKEKLHFDEEALQSTEKQDLIVDNTIAPEAEKDQTYSNGDDIAQELGVNEAAQEDITLHTTTE